MSVPLSFVRHQLPMLNAIGRTAALALKQKVVRPRAMPPVPGPILTERLPPRDPKLVEAFLAHVGSRPGTWADGQLPPHFFPQWVFARLSRALEGLPYPVMAMLNGGCHLTIHRPMPMGEAIDVEVQLTEVDDDGRLAVITERCTTGTATAPAALDIEFHPVVRLPKKKGAGDGPKKDKPTIPTSAREIGRWSLAANAGLEFALLTGDFNPIHWIPAAAKAAGFKSTILHGFGAMTRAIEAIVADAGGDGTRLGEIDVRFTRPLVLPADVGAFVDGDRIFVGERPGAEPNMTGRFGLR